MKRVLMLIVCLLVPSACGGSHAKQEASRCEPVAAEVVDTIAAGMRADAGVTLRAARSVKSKDFDKAWFVAADLQGEGLDGADQIGVWATNDAAGSGTILAINAVAQQFTEWPHGDSTAANMSMGDDGAEEARACAEAAAKESAHHAAPAS